MKIIEHHAQSVELIRNVLPIAGHPEIFAKNSEGLDVTSAQFLE
jgi:hypothetical protein